MIRSLTLVAFSYIYKQTYTDEYRNHTTCISEAERYEKTIYRGTRKLDESGTGHRNNQVQNNKKLTPQEAWQQTIQVAADTAPGSLKSYMDQLTMLENVPRKEKQFRNFTINSLGLKGTNGERIKGEIWACLTKVRDEEKNRKEEEERKRKEQQQKAKEKEAVPDSSPKKTKSVSESSDGESSKSSTAELKLPSKKVVVKAMKKVLKKAPNKQLKFKALRKQVQESLALKSDKGGKNMLKKLLEECVKDNSKKIVMVGKTVMLSK